jgi:hypothetical protein
MTPEQLQSLRDRMTANRQSQAIEVVQAMLEMAGLKK